jgi:hypothetical protein
MNTLRRLFARLAGHTRPPRFPHLYWMLNASWLSQAVYVASALDVAERLRAGPLGIDELAARCGARPVPLGQVMRALAGFGVFARDAAGRYALTPAAEPLLHDAPFCIRSYAAVYGEQLHAAAGRMLEQVRDGETGFRKAHGETIWDHYRADPRAADVFDTFMSDATDLHVRSITAAYPFARHRRVVDVGAGRGSLLAAVLRSAPALSGVWYDRPEVLPAARAALERAGLAGRCEFEAGNMLERVPPGADLYLIKHVLHDWADEPAARILAAIAAAMPRDSRLIIIEAVLDERDGVDGLAKLRDLEQMFWTGGRVRSQREFAGILAPAGLEIEAVTRTPIVDVCLLQVARRR